jgi:hypothetical protein
VPTGIESIGRLLLVFGGILVALGLIIVLFSRVPFLGRLPGDIFIQRDNVTIWIPIATMIVLSIVLSVIFWLVGLVLRR